METANKNDNLDHFAVKRKDLFSTILYICIGIFLVVILLFLLYLLLGKKVGQTPKEEPDQVVELPQTGSLEEGGTVEGTLNLDGNKIINVGPAQQDSDAISRGGADERFVNVTGDTMIGDLTINGGKDLILASSGDLLLGDTYLNEDTSSTDSGAFLIGVYDEFDNSNSTNVQDVLDDLDLAISNIPDSGGGSFTETDPVFSASPAPSITNTNISRWNTAYGWGNHASSGYITSESDPVFSASPSAGITSGNISNWNTAYSWGNHALAGYLTSESDPVWASAEPNYFNLSQNETVNGIPAFNGGQSGVSAPFSVDSTYIVSNLNSDFLDSQEGSYFLNASNINSGSLGTSYYSAYNDLSVENYLNNDSDSDLLIRSQADSRLVNDASGEINNSNDFNFPSSTFISNLDTDYLDGQHGSYYLNASNINSGTLGNSYFSAYSNLYANSYVPASSSTIWTDTNDGTGSGLDADTLDGSHGSSFMSASTDDWVDEAGDIISGTLTFSSVATDINVGSNEDLTLSAPGNGHIVLLPDTGNVGIGTTSPSDFKLQVNGSIGPSSAPTPASQANTLSTIDSTGDVGYDTSIAIGTDGLPVISHTDTTNGDLRVCKCNNTSCTSAACSTIDSTNDVGYYTSIAIGTDSLPVISQLDNTNQDLRVCKCNNTSCTSAACSTIDSTNVVGYYTSIAIGTDSLPVISQLDTTNGDLRICKCNNTSCTSAACSTIDSTNAVGYYTSIAIGTDGLPVISHWDATNGNLRICRCNNTSCTSAACSTIDSTNDVGSNTSIAIGTDGLPVISHWDATNGNLRICKCNNTSCTSAACSTIDSTNDVGSNTSIAIGTDGLPVISHQDQTNWDLRVCKCNNTSCTSASCSTVDSTNNVGRLTSIAIGTDSLPIISHQDQTNGDLRVVKCGSPSCNYTPGYYWSGGSDIGSLGKYFNNVYAVNYWAKEGMQISNFDLAEDYEAVDPAITAGDVVAPAPDSNTSINKTNFAYQNNVIGVVSTKPGLKLSDWSLPDEERELMRPVSLAGRVPVKVTTDNGPIKKGDFLVSSSKPGYAMKACGTKFCQPGTVIGKALEDFDPYNSGNSPQVTEELSTLSLDPSAYEEDTIMMFVNLSWYNPPSTITLSPKTISNDAYSSFWDGNLDTIDTLQISTNLTAREGVFQYIKVDSINVENLDVTELLTSREIKAGVLKAFDGENIIIKLSDTLGKTALKIQNSLGKTVFSIDSTGKLTIKADVENSSVGKGTIKAGKTSVRINTKSVTNNSKVFTSPTVTSNAQLAVVEKAENKYFIVRIKYPLNYDLTFDWWLIN